MWSVWLDDTMRSMKYSKMFPGTQKNAPKDAIAVNHKLLVRAGYIDQLMAGSWTLLPLGMKVVAKISDIIRREMNAVGSLEIAQPLMHPKEIWNETGRWEKAAEVMYQLKDSRKREFALSFTHEEIIMDLVRKFAPSYKDLPLSLYQFTTKFRNETRPQGGILRGREFMMKDAYSLHTSEADLMAFYEIMKQAYLKIFERVGLEVKVTEASGGVFTENRTHEFQAVAEAGEDTIYFCEKCNWAENKEIFRVGEAVNKCPKCGEGKILDARAIEVGNIFPLGKGYAEKMNAFYTDKDGSKKPMWFGSYGIGTSRLMGAVVEVFHDAKGIKWPEAVAPFQIHLVSLGAGDPEMRKAGEIYSLLQKEGIEVLWDETDRGAGEKFADADLIGIPVRLVVSPKTGDKIEWKRRESDKAELIDAREAIMRLNNYK